MNCLKCFYFNYDKQLKGEVNGDCRFDPPDNIGFPSVKSNWWCGKFKKKPMRFKRDKEKDLNKIGFW
jgi:hypothetical protein